MNEEDVQQFFGGFLDSLLKSTGIVQMLKECMKDTEELASEIEDIVHDLKSGGPHGVKDAFLHGAPELIMDAFDVFKSCRGLEADIERLAKWLEKFTDPAALAAIVGRNAVMHAVGVVK